MGEKTSRVYRLLKLINCLHSGVAFSSEELAKVMEVSVRTVYRDLDCLTMAGIPYFHDPDKGGYRISKSFFLAPVDLTEEEALALLTLGEGAKLTPFQEAAHAGLMKIRNVLPAGIRESIADVIPRIRQKVGAQESRSNARQYYRMFCQAIRDNRVVTGRYYSQREKQELQVRIRPYTLFFAKHSWYVIGYSEKHRINRMFKLGRFLSLTITDKTFVLPPDFSVEQVIGNAWGVIRGKEEYRVVVRFSAESAPFLRETFWHPTQQIRDLPDGGCEFEVMVSGLDEIKWWLLGWGEMAVVLQPAELRNLLRKSVSKMTDIYNDNYTNTST